MVAADSLSSGAGSMLSVETAPPSAPIVGTATTAAATAAPGPAPAKSAGAPVPATAPSPEFRLGRMPRPAASPPKPATAPTPAPTKTAPRLSRKRKRCSLCRSLPFIKLGLMPMLVSCLLCASPCSSRFFMSCVFAALCPKWFVFTKFTGRGGRRRT